MTTPSITSIRRRLFLLLMQAFGIVVGLTVLILLGLILLVVNAMSRDSAGLRPDFMRELEAYYAGRGSWAGVEVFAAGHLNLEADNTPWESNVLLDAAGQVVLEDGRADTALVGQTYTVSTTEAQLPLLVNAERVGTLVLRQPPWFYSPAISSDSPVPAAFVAFFIGVLTSGLLVPVTLISFFTGLLTLVIGFLLARRVVTPLADVIAAAQAVAAGDLATRVVVRGPDDLRGLSDSFNRMAEALERTDRQRRDLLADIAHELRTPLTVLRGKLEGIMDGVYPPDETHIAPALSQTYLLERLVDDLRLLALAEARQLPLDLRPVALDALAQQAVALFEAEAADKNIALQLHRTPPLPPVQADQQRIGQVIGNLVSNALQYVPAGGRVNLSVRACSHGVELSVSDNGPGVPEAELPHLFDRFWRGEKSRARESGGAGLGLAIAKQLVEAQGGTLTARRAPEGGLQMIVWMKALEV